MRVIVSRSSQLARLQVAEALAYPGFDYEVLALDTPGDRDKVTSLLGGEASNDFFTRDLHEAVRDGRADFAVHSAKDLDLPLPRDIVVAALLPAADQGDSLVCRRGWGPTLGELPAGARVATSSPSRRDQLLALRPDLQVAGIRGNIEQRLDQVDSGAFEAVIVATCALDRLGLAHRVGQRLPFTTHPLQGHLAVTCLVGRKDLGDLWAPFDVRAAWGWVSLVGAGPGDPELVTLKARRLLDAADLILTDSLANPEVLRGVRAEVRFVGKRGDAGGEAQLTINEALHQAARAGKRTVRLKGGDPMVFGRATEEVDYLRQRLVDVEIVPGISAAQAASATTLVPLTERGVSSSVAYCLGAPEDRISVPTADTLVYYMASATLGAIVGRLLAAGRGPLTPVLLVRNASLADQSSWFRTLGSLAAELEAGPSHPYRSPLLLVVGASAHDRGRSWADDLPRVWYTGTNPDRYDRAARLVHGPLIAIEASDHIEALDRALGDLGSFQWAVFPSRPAVEAVFARVDALGLDARAWAGVRLATVGRSTAKDLAKRGLRADLVPGVESSEGLVRAMASLTSAPGSLWLPSSDQALPDLGQGLEALGFRVVRTEAYRNVPAPDPGVGLDTVDEVVLTSPTAARAFARLHPAPDARVRLVPMGSQTRRCLEALFPHRTLGSPVLGKESP